MSEHEDLGSLKHVILTFLIISTIVTILVTGASAQVGLISISDIINGEQDASALQSVPAEANFVARTDIQGVMQDDTTNQIIQSSSNTFINKTTQTEDILQISSYNTNTKTNNTTQTSIQPSDIGETIVFGKIGLQTNIAEPNYQATIIQVQATPEEIMNTFYGTNATNESTYKGQTILENQHNGHVAIIDDNLYIVGSENAVKDSIDTALGDKKAIDRSLIPEVQGDTYSHVLAYNITGSFDFSQNEDVPIPNNLSMTYTTTDQNEIILSIVTESNTSTDLTEQPEYSEENISEYENITVNPNILLEDGKTTIKIQPEDVENFMIDFNQLNDPLTQAYTE